MNYKNLTKGHRIEYYKIKNEQLQFSQTPPFRTMEALDKRLDELHQDKSIQSAIVVSIRFFDKSIIN